MNTQTNDLTLTQSEREILPLLEKLLIGQFKAKLTGKYLGFPGIGGIPKYSVSGLLARIDNPKYSVSVLKGLRSKSKVRLLYYASRKALFSISMISLSQLRITIGPTITAYH